MLSGLGAGSLCVAVAERVRLLAERDAILAIGLGIVGAVAILGVVAAKNVDRLELAAAIDRALDLRGRIANAVALATDDSVLARLSRRDAERRAEALEPRALLPYRLPSSLALAFALLGLATGIRAFSPRFGEATRRATATTSRLVLAEPQATMEPDTARALRERLDRVRASGEPSSEVREATGALNELIEAIARGAIEEREAMERIAALEESWARSDRSARAAMIARELREAARQARPVRSTRELVAALEAARLEDAARILRDASRRARTEAPSRDMLESLRSLARDQERDARERELAEAERELERALERREQRDRSARDAAQDERLLERRREELERLRREHEARREAERELERLRRELDAAAESIEERGREPNEAAADAMERAAEELSRHAREMASAEAMRELAEALRRLREAVREARETRRSQEGTGGDGERREEGGPESRMRRFVLRAGGGDPSDGGRLVLRGPGGPSGAERGGSDGPGRDGRADRSGTGESDDASNGTGGGGEGAGGAQRGAEGASSGEPASETVVVLGERGDAVLEIPGAGAGTSGEGGRGGERDSHLGRGQGVGHDPRMLDEATERLGVARSVRVTGEVRRGPTRSQVIRGADARGFASRDYERVYADYASHAEEAVERDRVPPGRRASVRRYFELIRPRPLDASGDEEP